MSDRGWTLDLPDHGLPGRLIGFSGVDGSGKTTTMRLTARYLRSLGHTVRIFKVPSRELKRSRWFRRYSADPFGTVRSGEVDLAAMCALVLGDRLMTIGRDILPLLRRGQIVLVDRYLLTPLAELIVQDAKPDIVEAVLPVVRRFPKPDLIVVTEVSGEQAMARVRQRPGEADDPLTADIYQRRIAAFRHLAVVNSGVVVGTGAGLRSTLRDLQPHLTRSLP